jgi:hypothetical protein
MLAATRRMPGGPLFNDAREPALSAADIGHAASGEVAQVVEDQAHVKDARVDGRGIVFFIVGGAIEILADVLVGRARRGGGEESREPLAHIYSLHDQARVRKIGMLFLSE